MAAIHEMINVPVRSISLPSRLHPNSIEAELKTLGLLSTSQTIHSGSGETISTGFTRLANLYNNIEEILQSPHTQQALGHQQNVKLVEAALEDSVGWLDACDTARDLIMMMKEQVEDLQSALRRRGRGGDSSIGTNILAYISFRKKLKKNIGKSLRVLKRLESKNNGAFPLLDCHVFMAVKALRESNTITISMFQSLLSFLSVPEMKTKAGGGWSLISKLLPVNVVAADRSQKLFNEVGIVDFTLYGQVRKSDAKIDAQTQLRRLETLSSSIQGLEAALDCLFRCLIRNRVSLLNILTP